MSEVWFRDKTLIWKRGLVISETETTVSLQEGTFPIDSVLSVNTIPTENIPNLINLTHLHEPAILDALDKRYNKEKIYTYTGPILIAINPFKNLPLYNENNFKFSQRWGFTNEIPKLQDTPHVYSIADYAYRKMLYDKRSQSILISGESGAGKTVSTKVIMRYLTRTGTTSSSGTELVNIEDTILDSNPILEAFGNASTIRNHNSSRFGKYIKLCFDNDNLQSGTIETYLLETVRLIKQSEGERNFHVFYQMLEGLSDEQLKNIYIFKKDWKLVSKCENSHINDIAEFQETCKAFQTMKFSETVIQEIWMIISAVLHLGELTKDLEGDILDTISKLLCISRDILEDYLSVKYITTPTETYKKKLKSDERIQMRNTLIKSIYSSLFDYLVKNINRNMCRNEKDSTEFIGILDIFGFEVFKHNYFEQLCINYTNEILQQQFNKYIFRLEQEEYAREGIAWKMIDYPDNTDTIKLISGRPVSIFTLLDQEITVAGGNDRSYIEKLERNFKSNDRFNMSSKMKVDGRFTVCHYAGDVSYNTDGFCYKNKNTNSNEIIKLFESSKLNIFKSITKRGMKVKRKTSISRSFCKSLSSLVKMISKTDTHYIRCIKPNNKNTADIYDRKKVVEQLRYAGVLEAIRVSRAGYPIRMLNADFYNRYSILGKSKTTAGLFLELESHEDQYQIGITKVFLRRDEYYKIEGLRNRKFRSSATLISKLFRKYKCRKVYLTIRKNIIIFQSYIRRNSAKIRVIRLRSIKKLVMWWRRIWGLRKYNCAVKISSIYRKYITRQKYLKFCMMVIKIQRFIRTHKPIIKEEPAAIKIDITPESTPIPLPEPPIPSPKNNRIESLENQMSVMSQNIEMIMSNFSKTDQQSTEKINKLEKELTSSRDIIEEQRETIKQDEVVKKNMGQKLYDVLLSLNDAKEEIQRLRKMNERLQKKKWFW